MARKSRIESVRRFLEEAKKNTLNQMYQTCANTDFLKAEVYNRFIVDILIPAIQLCGEEKLKEDQK